MVKPLYCRMNDDMLKPVEWVGSSKADLKRFPDPVQDRMGFAIYQAQAGLRHRDVKPHRGFGSGVLEGRLAPRRRHLQGHLHGAVRDGGLCPARLPEEGQEGRRHAEAGIRPGPAPPESRRTALASNA